MKIQVRKNILSNKWEVQKQERTPRFEKVAEFTTKEAADNYALALSKGEGNKVHAAVKKVAQKAKKVAKKRK